LAAVTRCRLANGDVPALPQPSARMQQRNESATKSLSRTSFEVLHSTCSRWRPAHRASTRAGPIILPTVPVIVASGTLLMRAAVGVSACAREAGLVVTPVRNLATWILASKERCRNHPFRWCVADRAHPRCARFRHWSKLSKFTATLAPVVVQRHDNASSSLATVTTRDRNRVTSGRR